jgi:hypothetical protein
MSTIDVSGIDETKPEESKNASTSDLRSNLSAIKQQLQNAASDIDDTLDGTTHFTDLNVDGDLRVDGGGKIEVGDPGTEDAGININGTVYTPKMRVNDIGTTNPAQVVMHRHSTTLQPLILGARSNSETSAHAAVTAGQSVFSILGAGYTVSHYDLFGSIDIAADTGTISATSSPGKIILNVTPDGSNTPAIALTISQDKSAAFVGAVSAASLSLTTDLPITEGGTGQSTAQAAIDALTQVSAATNEYVLTKDTTSGSAEWKVSSGAGAGTIGQAEINTSELTPIVQIARTDDGAVATGTTLIPFDDTIPQITEGDEYITVSITPTSATNKLIIEAVLNLSHSVATSGHAAALFQDAVANALAVGWAYISTSTGVFQIKLNYEMVAGTTSSTTFRIRIGSGSAGTTTFNGISGARKLGGVMNSYIKVTEVLA